MPIEPGLAVTERSSGLSVEGSASSYELNMKAGYCSTPLSAKLICAVRMMTKSERKEEQYSSPEFPRRRWRMSIV